MTDPLATSHSQGGFSVNGDGSDGVQTFDGAAVVLGLTPSSSTYTLTRDIFLDSGSSISAGASIKTAGFRVFCRGNLQNNGTIQWNGNAAVNNTAGAALSGAGGSINTSATVGQAGAAGATGAGAAGTSQAAASLGGAGGAGGVGSAAGGGASTVTAPTATMGAGVRAQFAIEGVLVTGAGAFQALFGGAGGSSGGGDATHTSGGGGGGAGVVIVAAGSITGTGTISANGGAGGAASAGGTNSGGGGGGGGGVVIVVAGNASAGAIPGQTITASGGALGTHLGTGADGNPGSVGTVIVLSE